jgi:hypothetical protein
MSASILFAVALSGLDNRENSNEGVPGMRRNFSVSANDTRERLIRELSAIVGDAVRHHRRMGEKNEFAMQSAARDLGIKPRRVRAYQYGEVFSMSAEEAETIRAAQARMVAQRARYFEERARAEIAALQALETECVTQFTAQVARSR